MTATSSIESPENLLAKASFLYRVGNVNEAESVLRSLLVSYPENPDILTFFGIIRAQQNKCDEAIRSFEKAIAINPDHAVAQFNLGDVLSNLKRYSEALASYDKTIVIQPSNDNAYHNRAVALLTLKQYDEAMASCDKAIEINPRNVNAYNTRATILQNQKHYNEALISCDNAISINPHYANAHNSRGLALDKLKRYGEALESYDKAIAINPGFSMAYTNRGSALTALAKYDEALESHDKAIAANPSYADAHWNKSLLTLLLGDYEEGWKLYEWRWKKDNIDKSKSLKKSLWSGREPLAGKTILLQAEQGLGDTVQFCRYVPMVKALGGDVILEVQPPLAKLIATSMKSVNVIARGSPLPEFDFYCPLMSLPLAFETTLHTIPADTPYLHTNANTVKVWQDRLGIKSKPRIGLVWSGSITHTNDQNRSIALSHLIPLLDMGADFYSLQKDVKPDDQVTLENSKIISLTDRLKDFSDTAALISEMDIVISVDTSVAHLAGALDKPVWILLPFVPDFRWLLDREDSPWYPTARLFRQQKIGDWESVIAKVKEALECFINPLL